MKSIFKYPIQVTDFQKVAMHQGAKILCAQMQRDQLCLWAEVDPDQPLEARMIEIYGTGHSMTSAPIQYIGTVQTTGGALVWHLYERLP